MPLRSDRLIVMIPCGAAKQLVSCPAGEMYLGCYHRLCLKYALTLTPRENVFILSARYGLLNLNTRIESYDLCMGQRGSIGAEEVWQQATLAGLLGCSVIALGGRSYTGICRAIWQERCLTPLEGVGGIGKQQQWLKQQLSGREGRGSCHSGD